MQLGAGDRGHGEPEAGPRGRGGRGGLELLLENWSQDAPASSKLRLPNTEDGHEFRLADPLQVNPDVRGGPFPSTDLSGSSHGTHAFIQGMEEPPRPSPRPSQGTPRTSPAMLRQSLCLQLVFVLIFL